MWTTFDSKHKSQKEANLEAAFNMSDKFFLFFSFYLSLVRPILMLFCLFYLYLLLLLTKNGNTLF